MHMNNAKTEADVRTAVSTALSQVGGIFRDAGISLNIDVVALRQRGCRCPDCFR